MPLGLLSPRSLGAQPQRTATLEALPDGADGVRVTLDRMAQLTRAAKVDPAINELALAITAAAPSKNWPAYARAIMAWVQANIRYVNDPEGVELLREPQLTLQVMAGDCDDQATLVAALVENLGMRARFKAVAYDTDEFGTPEYSHVYAQVKMPQQGGSAYWLAMETTEPYSLGQEAPGIVDQIIQYV